MPATLRDRHRNSQDKMRTTRAASSTILGGHKLAAIYPVKRVEKTLVSCRRDKLGSRGDTFRCITRQERRFDCVYSQFWATRPSENSAHPNKTNRKAAKKTSTETSKAPSSKLPGHLTSRSPFPQAPSPAASPQSPPQDPSPRTPPQAPARRTAPRTRQG